MLACWGTRMDQDDSAEELGQILAGCRVLLLEDQEEFSGPIIEFLGRYRLERLDPFRNGDEALKAALQSRYDLLLLDRKVPGADGLSVVQAVRAGGPSTDAAIVMVTDMGSFSQRSEGQKLGADDYVPKPATEIELVSRAALQLQIRAAAKRQPDENPAPGILKNGPLEVDIAARTVTFFGQDLVLTGKEFALLKVLMESPGHLTPSMVYNRVWPDYYMNEGWEDIVRSRMRALRKKFEGIEQDRKIQPVIRTERNVGYMIRKLSD